MSERVVFRTSHTEYEAARRQIDAALSFPFNGIVTAFAPAEETVRDTHGRCYVSLRPEEAAACPPALLDALLRDGGVQRSTQADFDAAVLASRTGP